MKDVCLDTQSDEPGSCVHASTTVIVLPTERRYRVRCLRCGTVGPESESPERAWSALIQGTGRRARSRLSWPRATVARSPRRNREPAQPGASIPGRFGRGDGSSPSPLLLIYLRAGTTPPGWRSPGSPRCRAGRWRRDSPDPPARRRSGSLPRLCSGRDRGCPGRRSKP
jgi:hypothetical protein